MYCGLPLLRLYPRKCQSQSQKKYHYHHYRCGNYWCPRSLNRQIVCRRFPRSVLTLWKSFHQPHYPSPCLIFLFRNRHYLQVNFQSSPYRYLQMLVCCEDGLLQCMFFHQKFVHPTRRQQHQMLVQWSVHNGCRSTGWL